MRAPPGLPPEPTAAASGGATLANLDDRDYTKQQSAEV